MAVEPTKELVDVADTELVASSTDKVEKKKKRRESKKNDFKKRLQHISKEEGVVIARINKRSQNWRRMKRNVIVLSVLCE
ncbi:hypothetical protein H5410_027410, partial [Solanum commersonii]